MSIKISELPQASGLKSGAVVPVVQNDQTEKLALGDLSVKNQAELRGLVVKSATFSGETNANGLISLANVSARLIIGLSNSGVSNYAIYPIVATNTDGGRWYVAVESYAGVRVKAGIKISGTYYYI